VVESLKEIYQASDKKQAEKALARFDEQWTKKYPYIIKSWLENWDRLSQMFEFPDMIRKMIYTTNIIESFNSQLRKVTKSKRVFTNDQAPVFSIEAPEFYIPIIFNNSSCSGSIFSNCFLKVFDFGS
jgi:transposase-like protein